MELPESVGRGFGRSFVPKPFSPCGILEPGVRQHLGRGLEVSRRTTQDSEDLDLLADFNVERIQQFLNKPFERVGEALEKVEERLKAQNITLVDDLKRENDRSPRPRREQVKKDPTLSSSRKMGPRARFGDGPWLAVHWRRGDFVGLRPSKYIHGF